MAANSPFALTCDQVNVLILLSQGYTQERTALYLDTSRYAIANEIKQVLGCMKAKNVAHAVALAVGMGIISPPPLPSEHRANIVPTNLLKKPPFVHMLDSLTKREREIFNLLGDNHTVGLTNGAIANRLNVAICTVKKHLTNIYKKLNVNCRSLAVYYAVQWKHMQTEGQNDRG